MKTFSTLLQSLIIILFLTGCGGSESVKKGNRTEKDSISVPDTGFTGIMQYKSGDRVVKEATLKNGVRHGQMKSFYRTGQLYQEFWYKNGLREDTVIWYYIEGQVFRTTPYKHDTIDGIQKQFYRTGDLKAKIGYKKGLRTPFFEEYTKEGRLVKGYPQIVAVITDEYSTKGIYKIGLELSDKSKKVTFYKGEFTDNRFDTVACKKLKTIEGKALLELKKTGTQSQNYVGVIGEILTPFGNRYLSYKRIDLPYNDLK